MKNKLLLSLLVTGIQLFCSQVPELKKINFSCDSTVIQTATLTFNNLDKKKTVYLKKNNLIDVELYVGSTLIELKYGDQTAQLDPYDPFVITKNTHESEKLSFKNNFLSFLNAKKSFQLNTPKVKVFNLNYNYITTRFVLPIAIIVGGVFALKMGGFNYLTSFFKNIKLPSLFRK